MQCRASFKTEIPIRMFLEYLSHPWPVWSVWRVMVVSRWERERGHTRGHRLRCAAGNTGWGPVPGMYVIEVDTSET